MPTTTNIEHIIELDRNILTVSSEMWFGKIEFNKIHRVDSGMNRAKKMPYKLITDSRQDE